MMRARGRSRAGFTLIEVMVVMAIIVTLAAIGVATYTTAVRRAKEAVLLEDLVRMRDAIDQYYADKNKYPASLQTLASEKYLRGIPVDPFTNSADTWQEIMADPEPGNPSAEIGVYDVKSGAQDAALDGRPYSEW